MGDSPTPVGPNDWVADRLAEIDRIPDAFNQVQALVELASELLPSSAEVFQQALIVADTLQDDFSKAKVLVEIVPCLPESEQQAALERALTITDTLQDDFSKAKVLVEIASHLPESETVFWERALTIVDTIQDNSSKTNTLKVDALIVIASRFSTSNIALLERVLTSVDTLWNISSKANALIVITSRLSPSDTVLLERVLASVDTLLSAFPKAKALSALASRSPVSETALLERVFTSVDILRDISSKANASNGLASRSPVSERILLERALIIANTLQDAASKAKVLSAIAPRLSASERILLERALTIANTLQDGSSKVKVLSAIAPRLPASETALLERALTIADTLQDGSPKVEVLSALSPRLPEPKHRVVLERTLKIVDTFQHDYDKANALIAIAPHLSKSETTLLEHTLTVTDTLQHDHAKALALSAIAPCLPASETALLERALTIADTLQDAASKALALSAIAPHLLKLEHRAVLERTLTIADTLQDVSRKTEVLVAIAPHLPASEMALLERALTIVDALQDISAKTEVLVAIAPHLPASEMALLERALTIADTVQDVSAKVKVLIDIASHLPESEHRTVLERALTIADTVQHDQFKLIALIDIAPHLPQSERWAVLERALNVVDSFQGLVKAEALSKIAPHLLASDPALLDRALTIADTLEDDGESAEALKAEVLIEIAPRLPEPKHRAVLDRALTIADTLQHDQKKANILITVAPHLLASETALLDRALTITNTLPDAWPKVQALSAIAPYLPASETALLDRALTIANNTTDSYKASALSAIAPYLPASETALLDRALTIADTLQGNISQALALSAIAPRLPEPKHRAVLDRALTVVDNFYGSIHKAAVLSEIAPYLPELKHRAVLECALTIADTLQDDWEKAKLLGVIEPQISQSNLKHFLDATFSLPDAAKCLASPAIRLTKDFLQLYPSNKHSTALNIVKHIPDDADKTKFLSALIPRLVCGLLPNVLRLIQEEFTTDRYRTETLNNLVAYLPTDQTPDALNLIEQSIKNPYYQTAALVELIPLLPLECCKAVLDLLEAKIALPQYQASILQAIAKALTTPEQTDKLASAHADTSPEAAHADATFLTDYQHLVSRTLKLTYQLKEPKRDDFSFERVASSLFSQLAPVLKHLTEPEQTAMLDAVKALEDPGYQAAVLIALAPHFNDFVPSLLTTYTGDNYRNLLHVKIQLALTDTTNFQALRPIADQLSNDKTPYIKSPYRNAEAWVELASHPAGKSHQTKALRAIQEIQNNVYLQTQYLQRLIPHLAYQQRLEAANIIHDISDPYHRASIRVALARKFPESEFFEPARDGALALETTVQQIEQLSTLALDMPELLPTIIQRVETADTSKHLDRYGILTALAPHLPMRINREVKRTWCLNNTITDDLWDRALYLLARSYRDALTGGSLRNESAQDKDYLNLQDEIKALAQLLLMRDLEPPMAVGILGGWGGGKSYIMHLMQAQMTAIRSRKVDVDVEAWNANPNHEKLSPYVGHIYQIKFDAWTFAKSDLWASLMQTIFFELNRQISLEQQLARVLAENPEDATSRSKVLCEAGQYWPVLYKSSEQDRQWFLERVLSPPQLAKFEAIHNQGQVDDELWRQLGATYQAENQKLTDLEAELRRKQDELRNKKHDIRSQVDADKLNQLILKLTGPVSIILSNRISAKVLQQINKDITYQVKAQLGSQASADALEPLDTEHLKVTVQAVAAAVFEHRYGEISFRSFLTWFQKNLRLFGLMLAFLTLAILLPIAADVLMGWLLPGIDNIFPKLIVFLAPLTPGIASAQALLKSSQKWVEETNLAVKEYEQQLETLPQQLEERREQLFQNQLEKVKDIADLEAEVKLLEEKVTAQRQRIPENVYESLEAFVSDRIQDGSYEKRLGLMQQVKGDLAELSNRLLPPPADSQEFQWKVEQLQKVFPRGPARVVVYIDDLDRCPPDRVVQVLEAVQLLVKTPLFIAVLAIDERYITRALEQFYKGVLLRHGSPSGTDYLEKIIQLPYRVRPIMADTLETYLRSQVVIQDNATGSTKFSEFSRQEFKMLVDCCQQVDLSPRTLKRLTNVYKLFKIVCRTRGTKTTPQVQQAILALLALSGRYPNLMRGVFETIETCFEEQRDKAKAHAMDCDNAKQLGIEISQLKLKTLHLDTPLKDFFIHCQLSTHDQYLRLELSKLQHDTLRTDILPRTLTLEDISHEIFNLIRSFSFVGEIGEDPDDYRFNS